MIVVRFKVQCQPEKTEQVWLCSRKSSPPAAQSMASSASTSPRDLIDPDSFIATEVFEDRAALDRQESLPEVKRTLAVLEQSLVAEPEATVFYVSSSEPHGG
jgi:hypothetical protein